MECKEVWSSGGRLTSRLRHRETSDISAVSHFFSSLLTPSVYDTKSAPGETLFLRTLPRAHAFKYNFRFLWRDRITLEQNTSGDEHVRSVANFEKNKNKKQAGTAGACVLNRGKRALHRIGKLKFVQWSFRAGFVRMFVPGVARNGENGCCVAPVHFGRRPSTSRQNELALVLSFLTLDFTG